MLAKDYTLEGYRILDVLGVGGFGITYMAVDETLEERVAIKEFVPSGVAYHKGDTVQPVSISVQESYERLLRDFIAESRHIARIRHGNVIRVRRCFKRNGTAYLVMDYEDGEDFQAYLQRLARRPTEPELVRIIGPLLDGLQAVHASGLVHRDIKPSNIFIRHGDGSPVLLDFGAARQEDSSHFTAILTSGYAPIEQYEEASRQGPWTDIYGMAAVLYRAVTGGKPPSALTRMALDRMVPASQSAAGRYSEALLLGIDSGLVMLPEHRPRSVADWRKDWLDDVTARLTHDRVKPTSVPADSPITIRPVPAADADADARTKPKPSPPSVAEAAGDEAADHTLRRKFPDERRMKTERSPRSIAEHAPAPEPAVPPARSSVPVDTSAADLYAAPPSRPITVRVYEAPAPPSDDQPRRFDFVRPSLEILSLVGFSSFVSMVVLNIFLHALWHDNTLIILLISTVFGALVALGVVLCSRETNLYSGVVCSMVAAVGSLFLFVILFGKYL